MFICPNCEEKIHWKYSLTIRPQSVIQCVACGAELSPAKRSYNIASFISLIILFAFVGWVLSLDKILWSLLAIPLAIGLISLVFYLLVRFERTEQE